MNGITLVAIGDELGLTDKVRNYLSNKEFVEKVKKVVDLNKDLLVMCKAGGRSMMASQLLSQEKINCINISDGFEGNGEDPGWRNEGLNLYLLCLL